MEIIVAGSPEFDDFTLLKSELNKIKDATDGLLRKKISKIITIPDTITNVMVKEWALEHEIEVEEYSADWDTFGKSAEYVRNEEMIKGVKLLCAFWDGVSKNIEHLINLATNEDIKTEIVKYK